MHDATMFYTLLILFLYDLSEIYIAFRTVQSPPPSTYPTGSPV